MRGTVDLLGAGMRRLPPIPGKARAVRLAAKRLPADWCLRAVPDPDGFDYLVDIRSRTEIGVFVNGPLDWVAPCLKRLMQPGDLVLDIGANVGIIALPLAARARALGEGARVVAFEPVPANARRLQEAVARNDLERTLKVLNVGLSDAEGDATMFVDAGAPTGNAYLGKAGWPEELRVAVSLRRLDDVLAEEALGRPVRVVKLDVEGAEVLVLRGGPRMLAEDRPVILGEFNTGLMPGFGHTFLDAAAILEPAGYLPFAFDASGAPVQIVPEIGRGDILWVPEERVAAVLAALAA